jgi:FkbM family methyltransferase
MVSPQLGGAGRLWGAAKSILRKLWFVEGSARRSIMGPYRGLTFEISPQMHSRMIVFYDAYEHEVSRLLDELARPGMVVYVCGAHVGIHALHLGKRIAPDGIVYAFEPWPPNFDVLVRNIQSNAHRTARIVPVPLAVGAVTRPCELTAGHTDGTHHVTQEREQPTLAVEMTTLDDFHEQSGQPPALMVVDVEGEELNVLRGAARLLKAHPAYLIIEHHGAERKAEVSATLADAGYKVRSVGQRHLFAQPA